MTLYKIFDAKGKYWKNLKLTASDVSYYRKAFPKIRIVRTK